MPKNYLNINVYDAAKERIKYTFDNFDNIYLSFSGGKDSTVMLHMVMDEAIKRKKEIGLLIVDLEGQYKLTIENRLVALAYTPVSTLCSKGGTLDLVTYVNDLQ